MTDPEDNPPIPPAPKEGEEVGNRPSSHGHDIHGSPIELAVLTPGNLEEPNSCGSHDNRNDPDKDADDGDSDCDYDDDDSDDPDDPDVPNVPDGQMEPKGLDHGALQNSVAGDEAGNAGKLQGEHRIPNMVQPERRRSTKIGYGYSAPGYPSSAGILRDKFDRLNPFAPAFYKNYGHPSDDPEQAGARASEDHTDFEELLRRHHGPNVIYSPEGAMRVNIATLQRACLDRLRKELAHRAFEFKYLRGNNHSVILNTLIHQYVEMLKDYDYMKKSAQKGEQEDPFVVSALKEEDMTLLLQVQDEFLIKWSASSPFQFLVSEFDEDTRAGGKRAQPSRPRRNRETRSVTNKREKVEAFLERLGMACLSGAFLIGPMLLMVLNAGKLTSLLTPSICVFAFGIAMAMFLDNSFDVLSATAAYAAVFVVFVGTSTGSSSTEG